MKALVLAAGYGKRLEPLTKAVPKPMVPVANKPIIQYNLELLKKYGFRDIAVNIHYFPEQIENCFGDGSSTGVDLKYSFEEELLGTAGGAKKMARMLNINGTFIVIASDILTDINLSKMLAFHKKKKATATIALVPVEDISEYGVVVTDDEGRIEQFQEKPGKDKALSNMVNTGIYIFEPEVLDLIPDEKKHDFGHEVFPRLVRDGLGFYGYKMIEYWNDVGGLDKLKTANFDVLQGRVRAEVGAKRVGKSTWLGKNTQVDKTAKFEGTIIIGDRSVIGRNVEIYGNVSVGDKCFIHDGAIIKDSVIWSDTQIGFNSRVSGSIVGSWCNIEDNVRIDDESIISNRCTVKEGKKIIGGTRLEPDKSI